MVRQAARVAAILAMVAAADISAAAETLNATARIADGQIARASATLAPGERVLLEIALPDGRVQSFPGLGERLVSLSGKAEDQGLIARDIDRDGIDEIIIRGSVPGAASAVLVFRWDASLGEYAPVDFTDDRDRTTKFLLADAALPVIIDGAGTIEAQYGSVRDDGRKSYHVARFRWTGKGFSQSADN
jgi:hypothetical protein